MNTNNNISNELSGIQIPAVGYMGFRQTLKLSANLDDTLVHAKRIATEYAYQVRELADLLQGDSVEETSRNIWEYLRANTRYKLDKDGVEELRRPARSLVDGKKGLTNTDFGIDCDDYTILVSAILINLNIPHEYRVVAYEDKGKFQHIYPVSTAPNGEQYVIDIVPEIPHFNYEAQPIIDLKIIKMELHELSGVKDEMNVDIDTQAETKQDLIDDLNEPFALSGIEDEDDDILDEHFLNGFEEIDEENAEIVLNGSDVMSLVEGGLLAEVNKAKLALLKEKSEPTELSQLVNVDAELAIMSEVMKAWDDEEEREEVITNAVTKSKAYSNFFRSIQIGLEELEDNALNGFDDDDDEEIYLAKVPMDIDLAHEVESEDLDGVGRRRRRGRRKGRLKRVFNKVKKGVKKAVKAVVRYNPATMAVRSATLLVLRMNTFGFASKLIYAYLSENQAQAQGLDLNEWRKLKTARDRLLKFFTNIGGKSHKFKNAIVRGRAAKKTGLQLRGDIGVAITGSIAAASGFISFAKKLFAKINPAKLFKGRNTPASNNFQATEPSALPVPSSVPSASNTPSPRRSMRTMEKPESKDDTPTDEKKGFFAKVKEFVTKHKKKIIIIGVGGIVALVAILAVNKYRKNKANKRKRSLAGAKAARTRKRNQKALASKRSYKRKAIGRGSTTIIKSPTKQPKKRRVSKRTNASRLKAMHRMAKQLQKENPRTKYSTLLRRASKMI